MTRCAPPIYTASDHAGYLGEPMTITTPSQDRASVRRTTGEIPAQRTAPAAGARTATTVPAAVAATVPAEVLRRVPTAAAPPARVAPARVAPATMGPLRRRWPATVGGLAAGLTLGTVGAVGAAFALSATTVVTTAAVPASAVLAASLSPNVSVPGRVLTAFGEGTWQVGVDIVPGTYMTTGPVDSAACHHALRTTRTGGKVTVGGVASGRATVVLNEANGWFASSGCATWTRIG
jgi:hypothetical protein